MTPRNINGVGSHRELMFAKSGVAYPDLLSTAQAAAAAGSKVLSEMARSRYSLTAKGEAGNLVTEVDVAAEKAIRAVISAARPLDSIHGEELRATNPAAGGSGIRWSIDPLDGTTNYTRKIPYYCTSVAACFQNSGEWLVGVVVAPALRKTYFAVKGGGAWISCEAGIMRLNPAPTEDSRLLGTGFSYSSRIRNEQYAELPAMMADYTDLRRFGSAALEICNVAEGAIDGFSESDLSEHDWAAAALIAEEAGLSVARPDRVGGVVAVLHAATN